MAIHMAETLHLHLISDSTGETLDMLANAAMAQFEGAAIERHLWPLVRSRQGLERIMADVAGKPGIVLFTLASPDIRTALEEKCRNLGLKAVSPLDPVLTSLGDTLGRQAKARPGRQHTMDEAYFDRVDAIHFTIAHDDGLLSDDWEEADIVLAGVSRSSKTPTSIYLANRGYKTANIPLVMESPPPEILFRLKNPLVVGLTTAPKRLIEIRRNRLLTVGKRERTSYVDEQRVSEELKYARRLFADNGWPVIDVTRRSIEETAAAVIRILQQRRDDSRQGELIAPGPA